MTVVPRGLVVSCQGPPRTPLDDPHVMAAMAAAAEAAGAVGIRAQGVADIRAIRKVTALPIIGLLKRDVEGTRWITPTVADALAVTAAGADIVAADLSSRPRPDGVDPAAFLHALLTAVAVPILADVSTLVEGVEAVRGGAHAVASTLSGYTPQSRQLPGPDVVLVAELAGAVRVPVIAEGRYQSPDQVREALTAGAHAVVVGTAITNTLEITRRFVEAMRVPPADRSQPGASGVASGEGT